MNKHDGNFEQGIKDMDQASQALDDGKIVKSLFYAGRGISKPILGVAKDQIGFAKEIIWDFIK